MVTYKCGLIETNLRDEVLCEMVHGGILTPRERGVNLPNTKVSIPSLTLEDRDNLEFVLANDVE